MARNKITIGTTTEELNDARLPASLGTAGQVLAVNSDATSIEWSTVDVSSAINTHNTDSTAHTAIQTKIGTDIATHNADATAHPSKESKGYLSFPINVTNLAQVSSCTVTSGGSPVAVTSATGEFGTCFKTTVAANSTTLVNLANFSITTQGKYYIAIGYKKNSLRSDLSVLGNYTDTSSESKQFIANGFLSDTYCGWYYAIPEDVAANSTINFGSADMINSTSSAIETECYCMVFKIPDGVTVTGMKFIGFGETGVIGFNSYQVQLTSTDPGQGTAGQIIIVTG